MVAKISLGNSLYRALVYNGEKINKENGRLLATNKIYNDGTGKINIARAYQDFKGWMPTTSRTERPMVHISLNPHPDDRLTDGEYARLAREYLEKMGFGDMPYLVFKHEDIERHHIHIVALRVDTDGRCVSDKNNFYRSKDICRELESKYGLRSSERQKITPDMPIRKVDPSGDISCQREQSGACSNYAERSRDWRETHIKRQVANTVKMVGMRYRFQTLGEYNAILSLYNIRCEAADGRVNGREYHGLVYFATDDAGNTIAAPYKASRLGKFAGREAVGQRFVRAKEKIEPDKTRAIVEPILNSCTGKDDFVERLTAANVDVLFRYTEEGRIYGVTFIDHNNFAVLNGSRLGREFSANAVEERFNGNPTAQQPTVSVVPPAQSTSSQGGQSQQSGGGQQSQPQPSAPNTSQRSSQQTSDFDNAPILPGLDLFQTGPGFDPQEEAFYRAMQRRKKKRRRGPKL